MGTTHFHRHKLVKLFVNAEHYGKRTAVITLDGTYSYRQLLDAATRVGSALLDGAADLAQARVAFLVPPGFEYVAIQWGIWRAGGIAVPLAITHPRAEIDYILNDTQAAAVVIHPDLQDRFGEVDMQSVRVLTTDMVLASDVGPLPHLDSSRCAMIVYTSGTTSRPKGVVTTHANIEAQVESLVEAWDWAAEDHILNVLPLHHVHGIINVLTCALWVGAKCEFLRFNTRQVLERFMHGDLTLFMAVPTIYAKLIDEWQRATLTEQNAISAGCRKIRLMVSGSAALPVTVLKKWQSLTGHILLERYGMTEIGMALSNPLHGDRLPGCVGCPLPRVEVRRVDESGQPLARPEIPGEIEVRGPTVFREYWGKAEATQSAFHDHWFRTGDIAVIENGAYRLLGRKSVDIIKSGGYKVSALEIEEVLRSHPEIRECAVVGVPDDEWGERVAVCIVSDATHLSLDALRTWAKNYLAPYKLPTRLLVVNELPTNTMGKVQKPVVKQMFQG